MYYSKATAVAAAAAATVHRKNILADFLVNSVGFSTEEAVSISKKAKVPSLKRYNDNPLSVVNFFQQVGLDKNHIKTLVSSTPNVLFSDVDKTLKPKIKVIQQELGLSGSDLATVLSKCGTLFRTSHDNVIRPNLEYLRKLFGSNDSLNKAVRRDARILWCNAPKLMSPNIALLQSIGLSVKDIEKLILLNPRVLLLTNPEWLENAVHRVENDLHIPRNSPMFIYGVIAVSSLGESPLEMKLQTFRRFGWSDMEILTLVQKLPLCLSLSEAKLGNALNFFMNELGCGAGYLASRPSLLTYSLEKRVLPRHEILKLLDQKKLEMVRRKFYTVVQMTESKFLESYVLPFKDEMPELYELYMKSKK